MSDETDTRTVARGNRTSDTTRDSFADQATQDRRLAAEADAEILALKEAEEKANLRAELKRFREIFPRRRQPGGNDLERQRYLMAQQRLRWYARHGITLEFDEDGAPMPYASGTEARLPTDPWSLPTSMPTLKVRDPETLGRIIRMWRRRINEPISQLAQQSGETARYIAHLERGEKQTTLIKILNVTDALDMEILIRPRRSKLRA